MEINEQLIENYLLNQLSESEKADFEELIDSNPQLRSDVLFNKAIVNGVQNFRKEALKNRLNNIPLNTTFSLSSLTKFTKVALTTVMVVTVGAGIYLYSNHYSITDFENKKISTKEIVIDTPNNIELDNKLDFSKILDISKNENLTELNSTETQSIIKKKTSSNIELFGKNVTKKFQKSNKQEKTVNVNEFEPSISIPSISEITEEKSKLVNVEFENIKTESTSSEKQIEIETHITKKLDLKYKYFDRKLLLDGAFDKGTYKILEINGIKDKYLYIKYLGEFYHIIPTDKLTELPKVTDKNLIKELDLLDKNSN